MKKIILPLKIAFFLIVIIIFSKFVFSQSTNEKIKAFNSSIKFAQEGNYQKALDELLKIYKDNSDDYLFNLRIGYLFYLQKKYDNSVEYYRKAINLTQEKVIEPMLGLTLPLSGKEKWDEVEKIYLKILSLDSNNYTANLRLGQIYYYRKDYSKAEKYLKQVYNHYPSDYEANLYLGWTYFYLNKKSESKKHFTYALMVSENDQSALEGMKLVK